MASWWSLLSCGEISEEEDCEWERRQEEEWRKQRNIIEGKAKHIVQTIQTATQRNTSINAHRTVISPHFCVHNKSDAQFLYFIQKTRHKMSLFQKMESRQS